MRVWIAACAVAAILAAPAVVQAQAPGLEIVGPDELSVTLKDGTATKSVWVRNTSTGKDPVTPTFATRLEDGDGAEATLKAEITDGDAVPPNDVGRYRLKFSDGSKVDGGATGELVVSGAGAPGSIELKVAEDAITDLGVTGALLIFYIARRTPAIIGLPTRAKPTDLQDPGTVLGAESVTAGLSETTAPQRTRISLF